MRYRVNITKTLEGYSIWVPGLPGCWSQGNTEKEALENIKDAIKGYMETARELCKKNQCRLVEVR
jgi:predicted RNase H-like HicB family nuclease